MNKEGIIKELEVMIDIRKDNKKYINKILNDNSIAKDTRDYLKLELHRIDGELSTIDEVICRCKHVFDSDECNTKNLMNIASLYIEDGIVKKNRFGRDGIRFVDMDENEYYDILMNHVVVIVVVIDDSLGVNIYYKGDKVEYDDVIKNKWV